MWYLVQSNPPRARTRRQYSNKKWLLIELSTVRVIYHEIFPYRTAPAQLLTIAIRDSRSPSRGRQHDNSKHYYYYNNSNYSLYHLILDPARLRRKLAYSCKFKTSCTRCKAYTIVPGIWHCLSLTRCPSHRVTCSPQASRKHSS